MSEKTEGYTLRDERNAFMQERDELLAELHRLDERLCKASGHWLSRDQMIDAITSERDEAVRERDGYKEDANILDDLYHGALDNLQAVKTERDEAVRVLGEAVETLIWASGAFDTDEKSVLWAQHARPVVQKIFDTIDSLTTDKAAQE